MLSPQGVFFKCPIAYEFGKGQPFLSISTDIDVMIIVQIAGFPLLVIMVLYTVSPTLHGSSTNRDLSLKYLHCPFSK